MLATMVATAQQKSEMKRTTDYFQDEKIVLWDNDKAPHSNGLTGEAYEIATHRLVNTTEVQCDLTVNKNPNVIIASKLKVHIVTVKVFISIFPVW